MPGVVQVETDGGQKPSVENVFACSPPGRARYSPSPRSAFVPDLVTMFSAGPAVQPNSAENAFDSTDDFLDRADRHGGQHRLAAPALVVARAVEHERGRAPAARAGDEVGGVDEQVASALALAERGIEERQRRDLAAEDRRLVDRSGCRAAGRSARRRARPDSCRRR